MAKDELEGEDIRRHRRARRLARAGISALASLVVILVVVSIFALMQRNSARASTRQTHQELLVNQAQLLLSSNRPLATLLAIEADHLQPSADTRNALLSVVLAEPRLQRTFGNTIYGGAMAALAGHRVLVLSTNRSTTLNRNVLQVWDWKTGRRETWVNAPLGDSHSGPLDISATANGQLFAVISLDGMIQLYSGRTLEPQGAPFPSRVGLFPDNVANILLSTNGHSLAVSGGGSGSSDRYAGRSISVFSRAGNKWVPAPPLVGEVTRVHAIAFSADGSVIATVSATPAGSHVLINEVATGEPLVSFTAVPASSISLDWPRHRVVLGTDPGGPGDAVWYDLNVSNPTPHVLDVGPRASVGYASVSYDTNGGRLGISTDSGGFGIFDAANFTPLTIGPALPTTGEGTFLFLDSVHVLTALNEGGNSPMDAQVSLWNLNGTSVLATRTAAQFNRGVYPYRGLSGRFFGTSTLGNEKLITVLGPGYRPLGAPIPIDQDLQALPIDVQHALKNESLPATTCADSRSGRIATVSFDTGDLIVRLGASPFPVLSRTRVPSATLAPSLCTWSPDGHQIAIVSEPLGVGRGGSTSVALFSMGHDTVRVVQLGGNGATVSHLVYSADSKTLWLSGPNTVTLDGVYRMTNLLRHPTVTVIFPGATGVTAYANDQRLLVTYARSVRVYDAHTLAPLTQAVDMGGTLTYEVDTTVGGHDAVLASLQGWRLFDLDALQPVGPWIPTPSLSLAAMGPDGTSVYSEDTNGGGEIWNLAPSNLRAAACGIAGRNVTEQEWQKYLSWVGPRHATCPQYPLS